MGTTKDFATFGSFPLAIDMLNSLVQWLGQCYCYGNILADIPSGPLDFETSSEPNINSTSASVQRRYDWHNEGSVSGRSWELNGSSDRFKCCGKALLKAAFELAVVLFLCSVGVWMMYHNLMVFRACFQVWKKAYLVSLSYVTTWFLSFWSVFHCICGGRSCTLKVSISLFHHFG